MILNNEIIIFDASNSNQQWFVTNDDVMGGVSSSSLVMNDKENVIFSGTVSTENNGVFTMIRLPVDVQLNSRKFKIQLKIKGDGKKYQLRIKSKLNQKYWYVKSFQTKKNVQQIEIPLKDFYPSFRGYQLNIENFSSITIKEIAILIGNKKNENFNLGIQKIAII